MFIIRFLSAYVSVQLDSDRRNAKQHYCALKLNDGLNEVVIEKRCNTDRW